MNSYNVKQDLIVINLRCLMYFVWECSDVYQTGGELSRVAKMVEGGPVGQLSGIPSLYMMINCCEY